MTFFITDDQVQAAFDVLHSNQHAKARAAYEYAERRLKVVLAEAENRSEARTVAERQGEAIRDATYTEALTHFRSIARAYYEARDQREAAMAVTEAWRTQQSDRRAMARVA